MKKYEKILDEKIEKSRIKIKDSDMFKVLESVFDHRTLTLLRKLKNGGYFDEMTGVISTGKEANVYHVSKKDPDTGEILDFAMKIYRTTAVEFKNLLPYIHGDPRFGRIKKSSIELMKLWARKEYKNLKQLFSWGLPVPMPVHVKENILIMQFLGRNGRVFPQLKDVPREKINPLNAFNELIKFCKIAYQNARLVHADLSEFNVLYDLQNDEVHVIDVSQAVSIHHPRALFYLYRDLKNVCMFFTTNFNVELPSIEELFESITNEKFKEIYKL